MGHTDMKGKRIKRYSIWLICICIAVASSIVALGWNNSTLLPWHTEKLSEEFSVEKISEVKSFDDYKQLEDRLFGQLKNNVYQQTTTGPDNALVRYSAGSAADPTIRKPDWNRSFELPSNLPAGGVLLLHGMSDSPYSLRALGETFNREGYWVVGLRLPGHGTAPSGLRHIKWEDMAAAVRLSVKHLESKVGQKPIHILGYSTGAPLALNFTLDALEKKSSPLPASLVLISPAIGIHPAAGLARVKNSLSVLPGLGNLAWISVQPEFDPYKYNSFATNAGTQVHRLTRLVAKRIRAWSRSNSPERFPPVLVCKSTVDSTVSTRAVVDNLLVPLGENGHELVLFDINRFVVQSTLLVFKPGPLTARLMEDENLPFSLTVVANENPETMQVVARYKTPFSRKVSEVNPLNLSWPAGVISLSHVALPFPPDDPLYGQRPPENKKNLFLGQVVIRGEIGLLKIPSDFLLRLRHNPFYGFLEDRALDWVKKSDL